MARSDLLIALVRNAVSQDSKGLRSTVSVLAAEARAAGHQILASRLENALSEGPRLIETAPPQQDRSAALVETLPSFDLSDLVLTPEVRDRLMSLVGEQKQSGVLRKHGLEPRNRVLVFGAPGNGKTSVAEALAKALGHPLLLVNYDRLIGSHLGETNRRLEALFREASERACVLFFDEFDAIGKERADSQETGEIKRVVASLLMNVDALPSHVVVVAATNHPEMLDRAVWRRFQVKLELVPPDAAMMAAFLARRLRMKRSDPSIARAVNLIGKVSFAEAEDFALDVRRRAILSSDIRSNVAAALKRELRHRFGSTLNWTENGEARCDETTSEAKPTSRRVSNARKSKDGPSAQEV